MGATYVSHVTLSLLAAFFGGLGLFLPWFLSQGFLVAHFIMDVKGVTHATIKQHLLAGNNLLGGSFLQGAFRYLPGRSQIHGPKKDLTRMSQSDIIVISTSLGTL